MYNSTLRHGICSHTRMSLYHTHCTTVQYILHTMGWYGEIGRTGWGFNLGYCQITRHLFIHISIQKTFVYSYADDANVMHIG